MIWKDETSYGQREPEPRVPRTWYLSASHGRSASFFRIVVTKHRDYGDEWTLWSPELGIRANRSLGTEDLEKAQREAIAICSKLVAGQIADLQDLAKLLSEEQESQ